MAKYQVNYSDPNNTTAIDVEDGTVNDFNTSLSFPGRNFTGYGKIIAENFLHLLENFANTEPPSSPTKGQLWYDSNEAVSQLKIYDGTSWLSASGLRKSSTTPTTAQAGDLWVNSDTQQLFLYTGSGWNLVGPAFSEGYKSGPIVEVINDVSNNPRTIISNFIADVRVAIISASEFTPKETISGFNVIYSGVTLNANYNKYYGIAEKAEALLINGATIAGGRFLRDDKTNTTTYPFNISNSKGLSVGEESQFSMSIEAGAAVLYHRTTGSSLDIKLSNNGTATTVIRVDSSQKVGINKTNPTEALDVNGNIKGSGLISTTSTSQASSVTTGALVISGGAGIARNLYVGEDAFVSDVLTIGTDTNNGGILPARDLVTNIGSATQRFNSVYAAEFTGNFYGTLTGTLNGNTTGSAAKLLSPTIFDVVGDITSNEIAFDGRIEIPTVDILSASGVLNNVGTTVTLTFAPQLVAPFPTGSQIRVEGIVPVGYAGSWIVTEGTTSSVTYTTTSVVVGDMTRSGRIYAVIDGNRQRFFTKLNSSFISDKPAVSTISENDEFIVSRLEAGAISLKKISKTNLWKSVPRNPVGMITPYAGAVAPKGWLLCDGSEVLIADYPDLFRVIGFTYGGTAGLGGLDTFRLPDLRSRFPLGLSNMNNGITVPEKNANPDGSRDQIQTGGGATDRVADPAANTVGFASGADVLEVNTGTTTGTRGTVTVESTNQLLNVMNPFLTLNYIIYNGQDV